MAVTSKKANLEAAQRRLRLRQEQLTLRVRVQDTREKLANVNRQLKGK